MDLQSKELQEDYERWKQQIGDDVYIGYQTIGILDVLRAHYLIIDFFASEHHEVYAKGAISTIRLSTKYFNFSGAIISSNAS